MNKVSLVGRLGKDPELQTAKSGKSFAKFSIATNDGFGENKKLNWHNCTAFGKAAEIIHQYTKKGDFLAVSGSIDYNKHEDKTYTGILVSDFSFIGGNSSESTTTETTAPAPPVAEDDGDSLPF